MVKDIDEIAAPPLIDHMGWRLWRLSRQWKSEFEAAMRAAGHGWMTEARGAVIGHLRAGGVPQAELVTALGISKQAVQQMIDELVAEGVVERVPNPADARGRLVRFTPRGVEALVLSNAVKQQLEQAYRDRLGAERFALVMQALEELAAPGEGTSEPGK